MCQWLYTSSTSGQEMYEKKVNISNMREMQIRIASHHLGWLAARRKERSVGKDEEEKGTLGHCKLWWCKLVQLPWKRVWRLVKVFTVLCSSSSTRERTPKENENRISDRICTFLFVTASFTIANLETTQGLVTAWRDKENRVSFSHEKGPPATCSWRPVLCGVPYSWNLEEPNSW